MTRPGWCWASVRKAKMLIVGPDNPVLDAFFQQEATQQWPASSAWRPRTSATDIYRKKASRGRGRSGHFRPLRSGGRGRHAPGEHLVHRSAAAALATRQERAQKPHDLRQQERPSPAPVFCRPSMTSASTKPSPSTCKRTSMTRSSRCSNCRRAIRSGGRRRR